MQKKLKKILICLVIVFTIFSIVLEIPTIADWGDYESYDSSSSYDSWSSSSSSDWGSSSSSSWDSDWGSSSSGYSSSSSDLDDIVDFIIIFRFLFTTPIGLIIFFVVILIIIKVCKDKYSPGYKPRNIIPTNQMMRTPNADSYEQIKQRIFGYDDTRIEDEIQAEDPLFNKVEFLGWASDMFVKLQYAWSDRDLEDIRHFVTPELYEKTNGQVQRYIVNKQINKLERVSVNIAKLKSFEHQGDRDVLKVILDTKMIDYIVDENTGEVIRGDQAVNVMNPYILTFSRKSGVKTQEGGTKPVTMNCPNCGGATTILSSGKCPYCGSVITTRDNNWTLSEMSRYTPNS